jgi:phage FluMu gp28-like protein
MIKNIRCPSGNFNEKSQYVLGLDIARTGRDETAIIILEQLPNDENIFIVYIDVFHSPDLNLVKNKVIYLNEIFNFKKIIVDETGLGAGVCDFLKDKLGGKVEGIWYTNKSKQEIFNNLKILMQREHGGKLYIPDFSSSNNPNVRKLFFQFLAIQQEPTESGNIKIFHDEKTHDDLINALALAASYFKVYNNNRRGYYIMGLN